MFHSRSQVLGDGVIVGSAQTLAAAALEAIGKIRTASGSVTVMRADGEIVRVSVGDLVYRGDTIETEADGAVGITFADGTAFDLSAAARLVLNEFVCDPAGTPNSALLSLAQGKFAFIAGKVAKTGGLRIDTPFASIRGSARDRGVGVLTLAALTFAAIEESQAASRHDAFLDDGTITYKDLPHGTFEIVTRDGRVIMADDPGETIVVDPTGAVTRIPNSSSRMAELQQAQHSALATFSLGQEGGAAGGSGSPQFDIPVQLQPINFSPPRNDAPSDLVTTHITAASSGFIPELKPPEPKPPVPALGLAGFSMVTETFNTTGSTHLDTVSSGTLTFTDFKVTTVSATMASMTWSGGATPPSGLAEVLAGALSITTESADPVSGSIATTFGAADHNFDFLAANETLTIVYDVTATDNQGVSLTRPVTITITGTNDAPVLAADASGPHTVTEGLNTTGTFVFTDVDLTDHHTVSMSVTSATWSGGATLPSGVAAALAGALSATVSDGTGPGSGSVAVTFSAADSAFDFLAAGQTLKITYNVTLADNSGVSSSQPVTFTVTGTDDAPVITAQDLIGAVTEQITPSGNLTDSGTITFTDVDLTDVHLVSATGTPIGSVLGTLTAVKNTDTTGIGTGGQLTWTYTVADSAVEYLAKDQTKVESFTITFDDQNGGLITKQIDVTITGTDDGPVITAQDLIGAVTEQITPSGNLTDSGTITFTDVDLTDVHLVSSTGTPIGSVLGTLTAVKNTDTTGTGTGGQLTWTYTVADSAVEFLAKDQTKVESFTITLDDQNGGLITKQIDVTITGTNDVPLITAQDLIGAVTEQTTPAGNLTDSGTITFTDVDLTDVHLVSATGTPIGSVLGTLTAVKNSDTTGTGAGGQLTWTYTVADSAVEFLAAGQTKVESFTITLDDQHGGLITRQVDVTITGTNDVPLITAQDLIGAVTEQITPSGNLTDSGTITFTDVDLTDVHLVSATGTPIGSVLGTLTAVKNSDTTGTGTGGQLTWTYTVADSAVEYLAAGQTKVESFTITLDDQHGGLITKQIDVTITGTDDAPVITSGAAAVAVSEEGLPNGVPDTLPDILDTTNSTTANGTITASDADGDPLTMTLGAPNTPLTSGGVTIAWTLQNGGHTLVGKAGATTIITATITDAGAYTVTLTGPIDHPLANQEDNKTFAVPVTVSDGHTTTPATLSVTIEDDSPKAEPVEVSVVPTDSKTNVMLILDLSGSMDSSSGLTGLTRLDVAKAAINELLDQYDNRGDVMVRIVTFSDTGAAVGSTWKSVADAKAAIAGLSAGGSTNYDAALLTAMGAFTDGTKLTGPGTQNVSYFLSDGDPTASSDWPQIPGTQLANGIQGNEQAVWESFVTTNKIVSFALGIPNVGTPANLDPIAFDPASGTQLADTPIIVTDLGQLANTLVFTLPPVTGSILTGAGGAASDSFGADGGFVQSITVDGVTYTFNPAANGGAGGITTSGGGSFIYDGTTKTLTVDTDTNVVGGELAMVMTTGAFTFQPTASFSSESVGFVLVDRDGDTASSILNFSAAGGPDHPPIVRDDHVFTNIAGGSATNIVIPDYALLYNDSDTDGQTIGITGAITNVLEANSVTHASGNVTFTDNNTNGGSFTYTGSTTSPAASDTGGVTINRSQTGTTLTGTGFGEILIGRDGTNNTINANEGNDVLIGGTGNDTLNGGAGADMMTGGGGIDTFIINSAQSPGTISGSGDAGAISGYDIITDFASATDILNLQGTAAAATGTNVNGTDSSLTINGQTIKSHTISNGIITFDDANSFGSPLTLSSTADVAAAVDYLHRNNLGNAGATVAFVANIGGTAHTYIFEQVGNSPSPTNDLLVDLAGVTLSNLTTLIPSHILPVGVAGSPINLGLTDPADHLGPVTVRLAGIPSGWTLSEGADNGDGSWTVQASNVSTLAITSPGDYAGAMAFQVAMSWSNADGSRGFARATDNVEVFAQGAPIFAWSGDDQLTGSSGKDLFVFAQPIGHDTIYSFNTSEDQIDLVGYTRFANVEDVQRHLTEDGASNAVITLADGQSITLSGVPVSSLSATNFVFNHTPAMGNASTMTIDDGAVLPLSGIITNTGTIALDSAGRETHLELIQNGITLQGGGQVVLSDSSENVISGTIPSVTLTNVDNTISGAGQLGAGQMVLINNGTIIAIGTHALVIDTGSNAVTNAGTLEATGSGGLILNSDIVNSGLIWANGGNITINGAVAGSGSAMISGAAALELGAASSANVSFGADAAGTLILRDPTGFTGTISGLSSTDHIDLANISSGIASLYSITYSLSTDITTLVITDGTNTDTINLLGNYSINTAWHFSDDSHGGTIVSDAPVSATSDLTSVQSTSADNNDLVSSLFTAANDNGDGQTDVSSATVDGTVGALTTTVSDPDGSETTSVTINGGGAVAHTARIVSGPGSLMVNPGAAPEFTSLSHGVSGNPSDNRTVEVSNAPELGRTAPSRDRSAVNVLEGQIAIASVMLVLEYLTENFKLASDANAGTLIADPPASPDATVAAVAETRAVKAADTADTQATPAAPDEGAVAAHDVAITPYGGMSDLTISSLPSDFALTENEGDEPTAAHDTISLAYSEFADHGLHGSGKDHNTALNVAATNSAEGRTAAKASVSMSSHTTSSETGSDGNSNGGDAARIHDAIAGHSSTIDAVRTTISDSVFSSFRGVTSGHLNDQPHFKNATPGTLQSLESPTQATLHADEGRADHSHGSAAEHAPTIDTPATTIANSDAPGLRGEPPGHVNDQPQQLGNADPGNNGLGHHSRELPKQAASHAAEDIPVTAVEDAREGHAPHSHRGAEKHSEARGHVNDQPGDNGLGHHSRELPKQAASHAAEDIPVTAVEDAKEGHAPHSHRGAEKHSSTVDTAATTIADSDAPGFRGEARGHVNDQPGDNGLGHHSRELPKQAASHAAEDIPVTAVEDAKEGHAAHSHRGAEKHSSTVDTAVATIADSDAPGFRGEARGHVNDQPGDNGLGHHSRELPKQAASHAAEDIPVTAVEDAKEGHAAHSHRGAEKHSSTVDTAAATIADSDAPGFRGEARGHVNDQPQLGNANPGNNGLGHQSLELPDQAAAHAVEDIPTVTAVEDTKGVRADHSHGAAAKDSSTIDTPATTIADSDAAGVRGEPPGHGNDKSQLADAEPGNNGLGHQSRELPSQTAAPAAEDIPAVTAGEDAKGDHAAHTHGAAAKGSSTIDTPATVIAESDAAGVRGEPPGHGNDKSQLADADPGNNGLGHQSRELPSQTAAPAAEDIPAVSAGEDAKGDHAAHTHGAAAKDSSTFDTPATTVAESDAAGVRGEPPGHGNDKSQLADADPGNNGLGHQSRESPSQASVQTAKDIPPVTAVENAKGDDAAHTHGAAAKDSSTIDTAGAAVAHTDSSGSQGAAAEDMSDQFHFANTNPGTSQSTELPSHADAQPAGEIPVSTTDNSAIGHADDFNAAALPNAVEDAKGSDMAQIRGAAAKDLSTTDVAGATVVGHNDSSSFQGALSGEMNDQFHFANPNLGNKGLGQQSLELPNQATSHPAVEIPPATTELAQIVDDVLTQAAQAALDPGTTPDHNSQVPWTNTDQHNRSGDFITHA